MINDDDDDDDFIRNLLAVNAESDHKRVQSAFAQVSCKNYCCNFVDIQWPTAHLLPSYILGRFAGQVL